MKSIIKLNFHNPYTRTWIIPKMPIIIENYTILNDDLSYRDNMINYFYVLAKEKWLFKEHIFHNLFKYFKVTKNNVIISKVKVKTKYTEAQQKQILKYIDKYFITKKFIEEVLVTLIALYQFNWYDLISNKKLVIKALDNQLKIAIRIVMRKN